MPLWQFADALIPPAVLLLVMGSISFFLADKFLKVPSEVWLLVLVSICNAAYYSFFSGWRLWGWYFWPLAVLYYYLILALINCVAGYEGLSSPKWMSMASLAVILVYLVMPAFRVVANKWSELINGPQFVSWGVRNVREAEYIKANIGKGAFFAMGDRSGSFGFFLGNDFKFLQTEGLVSSTEYWKALQAGEGLHFLEQQKIDYFVVDRARVLENNKIVGVPEPIMGYSYRNGPYLICFDKYAELFNRKPSSASRLIYTWKSRVQCPAEMQSLFDHLRNQYGGLHGFSFPGYKMPQWADLI